MSLPQYQQRHPGITDSALDEMGAESFPASDPPSFTPVTGNDQGSDQSAARSIAAPKLGFGLFGEEHPPGDLVRLGQIAEEAGFDFLMATDHFHPWTRRQGQGSFVWSVLGGIASVTDRVEVGTGVTCPIQRIHPAIIAHAAATVAAMMPGRFTLGLGSGEALNEQVTGAHWHTPAVRIARLREAIRIIRGLLSGDQYTYHGDHFSVESARLFTRPDVAPGIVVAASGPRSAALAAENDGLVVTGPDNDVIEPVRRAGGAKRIYGQITLCWDPDEERAREIAYRHWPISALSWALRADLRTPEQLEDAVKYVPREAVTEKVICTSGAGPILDAVNQYAEAGIDHIYLHQVGPGQEAFLEFASRELVPVLRSPLRTS